MIEVRYRGTITPRGLFSICQAVGADPDRVLASGGSSLLEIAAGPGVTDQLLGLELFSAPDLYPSQQIAQQLAIGRSILEAAAAAVRKAVDASDARMMQTWDRCGVPDGPGKRGHLMLALGSLSWPDYRDALDAPLEEVLVWFSLQSVATMQLKEKHK